jgi:hypothetical protein
MIRLSTILLAALLAVSHGCSKEDSQRQAPPPQDDRNAARESSSLHHPLPPEPLARSLVQAEIRSQSGEIRNVFVSDRNLTQFSRPHHIYAAKVSPDNRYLMVWHMDFPPRKVSVYRIEDGRKISTFEPGAGGDIAWAAHGLIFHRFGAGTDTALWRVYTRQGDERWRGFASGAKLDPSGRFVLSYPTLPVCDDPIRLSDIRDATVLAEARPEEICSFRTHRWLDGKTLRIWYSDLEYQVRSIDLSLDAAPLADARP